MVSTTLAHADPSVVSSTSTFDLTIICNELTLSSVFNLPTTYVIGEAATVVSKPIIERDSCSTLCTLTESVPLSHTWYSSTSTDIYILSSDMSLVSQIDYLTVSDIMISTDFPGSCSDSHNLVF